MRYIAGFLLALASAVTSAGLATAGENVTLSGCVVRGEGQGFLLTNVPGDLAYEVPRSNHIEPGPVGTAGSLGAVFYWLDNDDDLAKNVGHQVEVVGEIQGDVKPGELKVDPKRDWTELEIKSDGRHLKVQVPEKLLVVENGSTSDDKLNVLVRRVDPKRVRMLAAGCN
jgi:hypothetical protein